MTADLTAARPAPAVAPQASLVDLLDRLLDTGVVAVGDVTISLAGVDLITVRLQALICATRTVRDG
jgi:hypothetical protein